MCTLPSWHLSSQHAVCRRSSINSTPRCTRRLPAPNIPPPHRFDPCSPPPQHKRQPSTTVETVTVGTTSSAEVTAPSKGSSATMTPAATDGATSQVATSAVASETGAGLGSTDATTGPAAAKQGALGDMAGLKEALAQSTAAATPEAETRDEKVRVLISCVALLLFLVSSGLPHCAAEYCSSFGMFTSVLEMHHVFDVIDGQLTLCSLRFGGRGEVVCMVARSSSDSLRSLIIIWKRVGRYHGLRAIVVCGGSSQTRCCHF